MNNCISQTANMDTSKTRRTMPMWAIHRERGFTLIELMITVAIIGLLAAIAMPSYTSYIQRGYRSNAKSTLLEAAQFMERYRATNFKYVDNATVPAPPALPDRLKVSPASGDKRYDISVTATATSFSLTAAPTLTDDLCGNLTLDNLGQKGQGGSGDATKCWNK